MIFNILRIFYIQHNIIIFTYDDIFLDESCHRITLHNRLCLVPQEGNTTTEECIKKPIYASQKSLTR